MKNLPKPRFLAMPVDVPPLPEQRAIAAVLDTIDGAIQKTEQIIAKLQQVKQRLLHDLLTRGIDDNGELRDPERHPEQFQDSPLGRIPKGWRSTCCREVAREITVGIVVQPTRFYRSDGVPVLRSANVRDGWVDVSDLKYMSIPDHLSLGKTAVAPGDVVTVRTGYPGTSAVIPATLPAANCVDIIITRPAATLLPDYLCLWVNSEFGRGQVLRRQGGLAQQHFNVGEMAEMTIALPTIEEQRELLSRMSALALRLLRETTAVDKLQSLKAGLSEDLLTGRVRTTSLPEFAA